MQSCYHLAALPFWTLVPDSGFQTLQTGKADRSIAYAMPYRQQT